jgi:hypothetical protein
MSAGAVSSETFPSTRLAGGERRLVGVLEASDEPPIGGGQVLAYYVLAGFRIAGADRVEEFPVLRNNLIPVVNV